MTAKRFDPYEFERMEVNGVPIFYKNLPWVNDCVHIRVVLRVGARHDPDGKEGLAHFFEHLPFDGCSGYPTFKHTDQFDRYMLLDTLNAYTSSERTVYHCKVLPENLCNALCFLKQFVFKPLMQRNEIERERKVITQEFWKKYHHKKLVECTKKYRCDCYHDHPLGKSDSALGWAETIAAITHDDLVSFHNRHYIKEHLALVLVGAVQQDEVRRNAEIFCTELPHGESLPRVDPLSKWQNPAVPGRAVSYTKDFGAVEGAIPEHTDILITRVMPCCYSPWAVLLFGKIVRQILVEEIRGKLGVTYSPSIQHRTYRDIRHTELRLQVKPDAEEQSKFICGETVGRLSVRDKTCQPLFEEIKEATIQQLRATDDCGGSIADNALDDIGIYDRVMPLFECIASCVKVTYEDICQLAEREFMTEQIHMLTVRP